MLEGYRRGAHGAFEAWPRDEQGRLWSEVLGLYLVARGTLVQAEMHEGRLLLSPQQEAEARRQAEEEANQLRLELERLRRRLGDGGH